MEALEGLHLPQFPDSCSVLSCDSALCTGDHLWPFGECVVGGGDITRGPGAMRIGGSTLGPAANSFPISSFYWAAAIPPFPFPSFSLDYGKINTPAASCLSVFPKFFLTKWEDSCPTSPPSPITLGIMLFFPVPMCSQGGFRSLQVTPLC